MPGPVIPSRSIADGTPILIDPLIPGNMATAR